MKKRIISILIVLAMIACLPVCISCKKEKPVSATFPISREAEFGLVNILATDEEFGVLKAEYGDSFTVQFSNGYTLTSIPFFDGYYRKYGQPLIVDYPGYEHIVIGLCNAGSLWDAAKCSEGDTVTITLEERQKYRDQQDTLSMIYSNDRNDYSSDEEFANFRSLSGGNLKTDTFFRGASPFNDQNNRVSTASALLERHGIRFILDLADSSDKLESYGVSNYATGLYDEGHVATPGLSANYQADSYKSNLADGFRKMMTEEGPYYVNCTEGKDRTGFVCILLEALAGATYAEIEKDYMLSYANYYGVTEATDYTKYLIISSLKLGDMLQYLADLTENDDLTNVDYSIYARNYLISSGMTNDEVDSLVALLTK